MTTILHVSYWMIILFLCDFEDFLLDISKSYIFPSYQIHSVQVYGNIHYHKVGQVKYCHY